MHRDRIFILLLASAGYAALALLAPYFDPSAAWDYRLDRTQAIARARQAAARFYALDVSGWEPKLKAERRNITAYYLSRHPQSSEAASLSPIRTLVLLAEPGTGQRQIRVELNAAGQPTGYTYSDPSMPLPEAVEARAQEGRASIGVGLGSPAAAPAKPGAPIETSRQAAEAALARLLGNEARRFTLASELKQKEGVRFIWEKATPAEPDLKLRVESLVQDQTIREISLRPIFAPRFLEQYNTHYSPVTLLDALSFLLVALTTLATLIFFSLSVMQRRINYRTALALFGALLLLGVALRIFGSQVEAVELDGEGFRVNLAFTTDERLVRQINFLAQLLVPSSLYALGLTLLWGAGLALARSANPARAASFFALLRGRMTSRFVAGRILIGLLFGGALAAVPYIVTASALFPGVQPEPIPAQHLVSSAPALAALLRPLGYGLFAVFGFLVPLFRVYIRRPLIVRALGLLFGAFWLGDGAMYQPGALAALVVGSMLFIIADYVYWNYDFLAVIVAGLAADIVPAAAALLIQPAAALNASGWRALMGLGTLFFIALLVSRLGRDTRSEDEMAVAPLGADAVLQKAERERLVAEFSVARRAQQHMLPDRPPAIPGYAISAVCRPAREVGGDLYDFLVLPNERIGFVVADVSGKGVPAALYMTLTKGLLASVAERESDPGAILRQVNRHLHEVCRRKVFVTMVMGVLDPATRTVTYARAGHNPSIWRRRDGEMLRLLSAPGLGLGLAGGKLFDRSLQPETIRLGLGDILLFYSDGITEAMNAKGEEFGIERLMDAARRADGLSADAIRDMILSEVSEFLGDTLPQDDITLVVIRVADR
jgi:serine phosphatase RsbU (regulator of sigma subunit)